ncbi:uncharacterized protein APUU_51014A [Aspergillus puulaauensis]|uniref:FAD dependent oxidoreductase domain-containing protein n=1 Tax=Aspergillus puulaauensis TaxID=1220207 RepID=A0A7R8AQW8_9EURO|nr:uncharacterized protein APUU_51014A [Aspergillus puulaauensis]BCS26303.1 hypothetical protein APUU_51014A [Aspergillus puulaauensis]
MYYGKYIQAGNNANAGYLPEDADKHLRDGLRQPVPQFGDRPWRRRRVCWDSDVPEGDSIAESHPNLQGLFIATGGSGHAFRFAAVLGRYIADRFENKESEELHKR